MKPIQTNKHRYYLLVFFIGVALTAFSCIIYSTFYQAEEEREAKHTLDIYTAKTESLLDSLFHKTDILESIIITGKGEITEEAFTDLAKSLTQGDGIRAVQYLPGGVVKYCYPVEGNEQTIGNSVFDNPKRKDDANLAKNTKQIALSGPYNLTQGGFGLVARNPIFLTQEDKSEKFWGFSVIILDLPEALKPLGLSELERDGYSYQLSTSIDDENLIIASSSNFDSKDQVTQAIEVPNHTWQLALSKNSNRRYYLSIIVLIITGFGITILCSIITGMMGNRNERLKSYAETDDLTGLVNRRKFLNYMELRCRDKKVPMVLLYIDIDNFKHVNDTFGHSQGDLLLKQVAHRMKQFIANEDVVARMGGDEFIMILEKQISEEDCKKKIEELAMILHRPIQLEKEAIQIYASIGYSLFPEEAFDSEELINIADSRMYKTKKQ